MRIPHFIHALSNFIVEELVTNFLAEKNKYFQFDSTVYLDLEKVTKNVL